MVSEEHYELLSSAVRKAWERLSSGELTEATLLEQAAGSAAETLRDDFLTTMNTHNTPSWQVRVVLDGVRVPPYHYSTNRHLKVGHFDVVDRASLNRYFQRGATVMLDDAQTAIPVIDRLCTGLTAESGVPAAGTIFASPPHAEGFALHQDAEDVVIVQLAGAKSWTVFPPLSRRESSMLNRAECGNPVIESQLRAGDILLLPKGSPHKTASNSADGSVHLTLGFYPVTLRDVVLKLIQRSPDPRLDPAAEAEFFRTALDEAHGCTVLLSTHHLANTRFVDRIIVLDGGQIVQEGTHADLLRRGGLYADMFATQARSYGLPPILENPQSRSPKFPRQVGSVVGVDATGWA
jgi:hypothetical protein